MENHRAAKRRKRFGSLLCSVSTVDDHRKRELVGKRELPVEEPALLERGGEAADGVEPRLAHGDRLRMLEQLTELVALDTDAIETDGGH